MKTFLLNEAFKSLDLLNEEDFSLSSKKSIEDLKDFVENDEKEDVIDIIDPEAEELEEIKDVYIGKVILDCSVCHTLIYKNADEIETDETDTDDDTLVNVGCECPYCYSNDGYKIVGQVSAFKPDPEVKVKVEPKEEGESEVKIDLDNNGEADIKVDVVPEAEKTEEATEEQTVEVDADGDGKTDATVTVDAPTEESKDEKSEEEEESEADAEEKDEDEKEEVNESLKEGLSNFKHPNLKVGGLGVIIGNPDGKVYIQDNKTLNDLYYGTWENVPDELLHCYIDDIIDFEHNRIDLLIFNDSSIEGTVNESLKEGKETAWDKLVKKYPELEDTSLVECDEAEKIEECENVSKEDSLEEGLMTYEEVWGQVDDSPENLKEYGLSYEELGETDSGEKKYKFFGSPKAFKAAMDAGYFVSMLYDDESLTEAKESAWDKLVKAYPELVDESLKEGLENVNLETDKEKISIAVEEKPEVEGEEMITPITPATEEVIEAANTEAPAEEVKDEDTPAEEVPVEEPAAEEVSEEIPEESEDDMVDVDLNDFDEESFDNLGESYLKDIYENVESFKTAGISQKNNNLIIEGIIKFNSGKEKKTTFMFEAKDITKTGKVRFIGENLQIAKGHRAFQMSGKINESKFIAESLNYNYRQKLTEGKSTRVYGTVSNKK